MRRATRWPPVRRCWPSRFQSTLSARRATHFRRGHREHSAISIHALREESDGVRGITHHRFYDFNPRPPRGERPMWSVCRCRWRNFNPRPPRGGRPIEQMIRCAGINFNPRSPWGERLPPGLADVCGTFISIHALREESDALGIGQSGPDGDFNPRPPRGGRPSTARAWAAC